MPWFSFHLNDFALSFLSVLFEGVPFLLLGSVISGLVDVFVSPEQMQKLMPKNANAAICLSGLLGLIFPMCECGSVVVIRRFIKKVCRSPPPLPTCSRPRSSAPSWPSAPSPPSRGRTRG